MYIYIYIYIYIYMKCCNTKQGRVKTLRFETQTILEDLTLYNIISLYIYKYI